MRAAIALSQASPDLNPNLWIFKSKLRFMSGEAWGPYITIWIFDLKIQSCDWVGGLRAMLN